MLLKRLKHLLKLASPSIAKADPFALHMAQVRISTPIFLPREDLCFLDPTHPPSSSLDRSLVGPRGGKGEAVQAAFLIPRGVSEIKDTESARNGSESERRREEQGRGRENQQRPPQKKKGREGRILRLELTTGLDCDHMRYERFDSS